MSYELDAANNLIRGEEMGEIINLRSTPIDLNTDLGHAFVVDCTRAAEGLVTDAELAQKYELSPKDWRALTKNKELEHAIRAERERRVRSGTAVKEAAARHLVKGVGIVDQIMTAADSHPKHKLDAFRELRSTASIGGDAEGRPDSSRFVIYIDLTAGGGDVERFDKERAPMKIDISAEDDPKEKRDVDDQW
jgi:hypothetical protein